LEITTPITAYTPCFIVQNRPLNNILPEKKKRLDRDELKDALVRLQQEDRHMKDLQKTLKRERIITGFFSPDFNLGCCTTNPPPEAETCFATLALGTSGSLRSLLASMRTQRGFLTFSRA